MNQKSKFSLIYMFSILKKNRDMIFKMTKRDIIGKYKGSVMGLFWAFLHPFFMLMVYTFVFSIVFNARWTGQNIESKTQFAMILFTGLIIHSFLSENLVRSPTIILQNANYVKKVIFPLELLPIVPVFSSLFHALISFFVLFIGLYLSGVALTLNVLFLPIIFFPLFIFTLGISWLLSSLGVYLRDISQFMGIISMALLFLSPIFYSIDSLPENFQLAVKLNPLTFIIEQVRDILIWGKSPNYMGIVIYTLISFFLMYFSFIWFQKTREGFADVI